MVHYIQPLLQPYSTVKDFFWDCKIICCSKLLIHQSSSVAGLCHCHCHCHLLFIFLQWQWYKYTEGDIGSLTTVTSVSTVTLHEFIRIFLVTEFRIDCSSEETYIKCPEVVWKHRKVDASETQTEGWLRGRY